MSFRLQPAELVPKGIRRIVSEQIASAIQEFSGRRRNRHKTIHSARQRCKRIRAVLRLAQTDLGRPYRTENHRFRDIACKLSDVRDSEAVIQAVDKLYADCTDQREIDLLRALRRVLVARRQQTTAGEQGLAAQMADVVDALREANEQLGRWPLSTPGFDLIGPGIQRTYAKSRKAFLRPMTYPRMRASTRPASMLSITGITCG
jgi:CHAD domain-containing protein